MRYTKSHSAFIILLLYSLIQRAHAYNMYVFVTRLKDIADGPYAYIFAEETSGDRDCPYLDITTSYVKEDLKFTRNNCSSTLYPPMAAVYKHPMYPRNLSYVISDDEKLTFVCAPFRDYTENDSMEYSCTLIKPHIVLPSTALFNSGFMENDFSGQIVIIPGLIFLVIVLLLASFLFRPLRPVLQ